MIDKILLLLFFSSSYGMYLLERGEYSLTLGINGYKNGATAAYVGFWAIFFMILKVVKKVNFRFPIGTKTEIYNFTTSAKTYLAVNLLFLLLMLFGFGGYDVLLGDVGKGEFRSSGLGAFGAFAYTISKFITPAICVYLSFIYIKWSRKSYLDKFYLFSNLLIVFIIGASWGGKSFAIFLLAPAFTVFFWRISVVRFALFFVVALVVMAGFSLLFDTMYSADFASAAEFVLNRLTIIQAEVPWEIWNLHKDGQINIDYVKTLIPVLGDTVSKVVTGLDPNDMYEYISYHYGQILTLTVYPYPDIIMDGHNVTGTFFSEALIALGDFGLVLFPALGALLVGIAYNTAKISFIKNNPVALSIVLVIFYFIIFPWISSGGVITLIHISNIVNLLLTFIFLRVNSITILRNCVNLKHKMIPL